MGEKKTVYAVSDGEYSSYQVCWLFENREDAEVTANRVGGYVEEFDLYGPGSGNELTINHRWWASVQITATGKISDTVQCFSVEAFSDEEMPTSTIREFPNRRWCDDNGNMHTGTEYGIRTAGPSEDVVRKAVRERAAKLAAELAEGRPPSLEW